MNRQPVGRWRQLAVAGVAVLLLAFAVESARHSVHHLHDEQAAAECWVAGMATHTPATGPEVVVVVPAAAVVVRLVVDIPAASPTHRSVSAHQERAPPATPSA
jgi:hypothetical protein